MTRPYKLVEDEERHVCPTGDRLGAPAGGTAAMSALPELAVLAQLTQDLTFAMARIDTLTAENRRLRDALATLWCVLEKHPALFAQAQKAVEARGKP